MITVISPLTAGKSLQYYSGRTNCASAFQRVQQLFMAHINPRVPRARRNCVPFLVQGLQDRIATRYALTFFHATCTTTSISAPPFLQFLRNLVLFVPQHTLRHRKFSTDRCDSHGAARIQRREGGFLSIFSRYNQLRLEHTVWSAKKPSLGWASLVKWVKR